MKTLFNPAPQLLASALLAVLLAWPVVGQAVEITGTHPVVRPPLPATAISTTALAPAVLPILPATPTEQQAENAYDQARKAYAGGGTANDGQGDNAGTPGLVGVVPASVNSLGPIGPKDNTGPEVVMLEDPSRRVIPGTNHPSNVALENIRLVLDVDNTSLRDVFAEIIRQAGQFTGTWTVKWRLKPEDMGLLDERVNLTAEAKFGDFVQLLTDRVRNLSGVQLFVTAFQESRVILVTDTAQ